MGYEAGFEVVTRWGDELLDVQFVDGRCRIAGVDVALVDGATGKIGHVDYAITKATRPPRSLPYARTDDRRVAPYLGIALAVHLVVWGVATERAPDPEPSRISRTQPRPERVARSFANATYTTPDVISDDDSEDVKAPGSGVPMLLGDRAAGSPEVTRARGHIAVEAAARPRLAKHATVEAARRAGMLGAEADARADAFGSLLGSAELAGGFDGVRMDRTLHGDDLAAHGAQGRPIWAPPFPRGGRCRGIDICRPPFEALCTRSDDVDARVLRRGVSRHRDQLVDCYEKRALAKPELGTGPLVVELTIAPDGRVTQVTAKGIDDEVAACVADVYGKIKFPRMPETGVQARHVLVYNKST